MKNMPELADLQQAVASDPGNPNLLYLLGAELAQRGEYDGAVDALTGAIAIDPDLHTARFQLGLLHLTLAEPAKSMAVLAALDSLPDDDPLKHFKRGLEALAADDFDGCVAELRTGIGLNSTNDALNADMSLIISRLEDTRSGAEARQPVERPAQPAQEPPQRTDFRLYKEIEDT